MSTRSTIVLAEGGGVVAHLYREMHDGAVHLELETDPESYSSINAVIPEPLVEGFAAMLRRSETPTAKGEGVWNPLFGEPGEAVLD